MLKKRVKTPQTRQGTTQPFSWAPVKELSFSAATARRKKWQLSDPHFLGHIVHHLVSDPRDGRTLLAAARTGHLGPTVFRSKDFGKTWKEAERPPAFPKAPEGEKGLVLDHVFWLTPGHPSEPGVWWAGSSPQGLFCSEDGGRTWDGVTGFNEHPQRFSWVGGDKDGTPDGPKLHSINIDPRDPNHMYIGMSSGGVFESTNRGADWKPLNKGCAADFLPIPDPEYGHDPHNMQLHPIMPDRLYQQNHCGIYRMERHEGQWVRIGKNMPRRSATSDFRSCCTRAILRRFGSFQWTERRCGRERAPMANRLAYVTRNAGKTWKRLDKGIARAGLVHGETSGDG